MPGSETREPFLRHKENAIKQTMAVTSLWPTHLTTKCNVIVARAWFLNVLCMYFVCAGGFVACMSMHCRCACGVHGSQERELDPLETGIADGCERLPCSYWDLSLGPLEKALNGWTIFQVLASKFLKWFMFPVHWFERKDLRVKGWSRSTPDILKSCERTISLC